LAGGFLNQLNKDFGSLDEFIKSFNAQTAAVQGNDNLCVISVIFFSPSVICFMIVDLALYV